MLKRLIAVVFSLVSVVVAGSAAAQMSCQISNNFTGVSQTFPGNYSVNVSSNQVGTLTAACSAGINSYNWSPGTAQSQSITVTAPPAPGSISYTLTGCIVGASCAQPVTITLVAQQTAPDCALGASPNPAVSGQTVTFNAACTPPAIEIHYVDLNGNPAISTSMTFTNVAPVVTQQTVRSVVYHGIGAEGEVGPEHVLQVTINPVSTVPPPSNCTLAASPNPVTLNNSFTLTAACSAGAPVTSYLFVAPNGQTIATGSSNTATVQAAALGAQSYTVRASNAGGQATASTTVTVVPLPPSGCSMTASPNPVFAGQQTIVTVQCTAGGAPTLYSLGYRDGAGVVTISSASNRIPVTPSFAGTVRLDLFASNAGGSAEPATLDLIVQQPACTITPSVPNPVPRNAAVTLTASCNNTPGAYQWSTSAGPVTGQTGASIRVTPATTTTYTVTASSGGSIEGVVATGQYTVVVSNASAIATIAGATITGVPGRPLSRALDVRVTDQAGNPVAGELVNWSVVNPGPSAGTFATNPSPPTNAQGIATNTFTMGSDPGGRTLRACLASLPSVCADFQVVAGASQIAALPGGPLVGIAGRAVRELAVQARDPAGNPVPGESVVWSVVNAGPNPGTFAVNPSPPTDALGITRNTFTMGADPGGRTLRACLVSSPAVCADFVVQSVNAALERPAAKIMTPMAEVAVQTPLTQMYNIRMRLDQLRLRRNPSVIDALRVIVGGRPLPSWSAFAVAPVDKNGKASAPQRGGGAAADQDPFERLGVFVNGDVEIGKQSSTGTQKGYELTTKGMTAGVDYRLPGESVLGLAAGYMRADTDLAGDGGNQNASGYSFSAYGSFVPAQGAYIDVIAHGGNNKYDTRRRDLGLTGSPLEYTSDTRGRQFAASLTAGADIYRGKLTLNPYLRVDYVNAKINGFNESGDDGAIAIRDATFRTTVVTMGGQASYTVGLSWGVLVPNARLELQRRVQGDNRNVTAALVADGTITTVAALESVDRNFGNVTVGASMVLPRGINGFANIERHFGRESYSNTKYTLGIRLEF
jgi:uncharacterized protein YhjY with autotransporter beta-barrel domain